MLTMASEHTNHSLPSPHTIINTAAVADYIPLAQWKQFYKQQIKINAINQISSGTCITC